MVAQRRYLYDLSVPEKKTVKKQEEKFKLIKNKNINIKSNKATLVLTTLAIFAMLMIVTYRYNLISEKNLKVQQLKDDLETAKSELATTQIAVEKVMDVNYVEAYAKQQLGMQKPEKSQLIYINMENEESVKKTSSVNMIMSLVDKIKGAIKNAF